MGGARGAGVAPRALALAPGYPRGKILMVIKCPQVTINMPRCDLLNVIFARQHKYL